MPHDIQAEAVGGLAAIAEGKNAEGIEMLRKAAAREDATEKHPVTPGPLLPAREILGQALMEQGDAAAAVKEFETVLVREPHRYRPMLGAAMAAEKAGDSAKAISLYNEGVKVMLDKRYAQAQRLFEQALEQDERIPEAHNNLAFSLRMQSRDHFARSLSHYNRALELEPRLAQAYMYRGVLYSQLGDMKKAREDLERPQGLDKALAAKLESALAEAARDERDGVAPQLDGY